MTRFWFRLVLKHSVSWLWKLYSESGEDGEKSMPYYKKNCILDFSLLWLLNKAYHDYEKYIFCIRGGWRTIHTFYFGGISWFRIYGCHSDSTLSLRAIERLQSYNKMCGLLFKSYLRFKSETLPMFYTK